jgi:flagellar motor switch protein FliM
MTILNVYEVPPLDGRIIFEINPNIAYAMLDRVLGGQGNSINKVENLTEIETKIMTQLFERAVDNLREAWSSIAEIDTVLTDFEVNPQFLQTVSPNETVVVISFNTVIGDTTGMINICIPHVVLEPMIPKLSVRYWMQKTEKEKLPEEVQFIEKKIFKTDLDVVTELGKTTIMINDFLHMDVGDVIILDNSINKPLEVKVGNRTKFVAQPGVVNKKIAVQVLDEMKGGELDDE